MQPVHTIITISFRQDRSSSNGQILPVPFYHRCMRYISILFKTITIDKKMFRAYLELIYRTMHGKKRSIQNVYLVYLFRRYNPNSPGNSFPLNNLTQSITLFFGELFGIIQEFILKIYRKNNGGSINRTGQTTTPSFITTGLHKTFIQIR